LLDEGKRRDKQHLIRLMGKRSNSTPNFALLIGAGTSVSSGVRASCEMVAEWRRQLYEQGKSTEPFEKWLEEQDWYRDEEEYPILFEKLYDKRSQRRNYIEGCIKDAKPSWGHVYLANMITRGYFNVVFTTNFDDLLNEACVVYADTRPIVCAHDSAVIDIRVTSPRPKIIKLHGDFLYDSIKNTIMETESLEKNMRDKFAQFASEYGLVVMGYGGNDRSVMDTLHSMIRSGGRFPHGIYWCVRDQDNASRKLRKLMSEEGVYWVKIDGFDEFMAEVHAGLGLTLPDTVREPYKATTTRLNRFIQSAARKEHPLINADIERLEQELKKYEGVASELTPYVFLADREFVRERYENAVELYEKASVQNLDVNAMNRMGMSYFLSGDTDKALKIAKEMIRRYPRNNNGYSFLGWLYNYTAKPQDAIEQFKAAMNYADGRDLVTILTSKSDTHLALGDWKAALSDTERALQQLGNDVKTAARTNPSLLLNHCYALTHLDKKELAFQTLREVLPLLTDTYFRAVAFAILDDKEQMMKNLRSSIKESRTNLLEARHDPCLSAYREDADFQELLRAGSDAPKKE